MVNVKIARVRNYEITNEYIGLIFNDNGLSLYTRPSNMDEGMMCRIDEKPFIPVSIFLATCENYKANILMVAGDMVAAAGGNYTQLSISGGVVAVHIEWICNLDWDFVKYCLPK